MIAWLLLIDVRVKEMQYLPINLDLTEQPCLIVGGGTIALRKTKMILAFGAKVTLVAPEIHPELDEFAKTGELIFFNGCYQKQFLNNQRIVVAATDNQEVNQQIYQDAMALNLLVNVVDQPKLCNFIMSSIVQRGPLMVSISSSGAAPVLARMLREKLDWMLPQAISEKLVEVQSMRSKIAQKIPEFEDRRAFWENYFERLLDWSISENLLQQGQIKLTDVDLEEFIESELKGQPRLNQSNISYIDLGDCQVTNIVIGTLQKLHKASIVYCLGEIPSDVLSLCRKDADVIYVDTQLFVDGNLNKEVFSNFVAELKKTDRICLLTSGNRFEKNWPVIESVHKSDSSGLNVQLNRALSIE